MRTYKYGSQRLGHEENATVPRLRWLGILSIDVLPQGLIGNQTNQEASQSTTDQESSSQESVTYSNNGESNDSPDVTSASVDFSV